MNMSFLRADGTLPAARAAWWLGWLPTRAQVAAAAQLNFARAVSERAVSARAGFARADAATDVTALSMRQGMGLVVAAGLAAGLLPFVVNWVNATRAGTAVPMLQLAAALNPADIGVVGASWQALAGLPPAGLPGWLAALLSSLGVWLNTPLQWLTWWLVYGVAVLLVSKAWSNGATIPRFLAVTSYAAAPLVLTGLSPIPCVGALAAGAGGLWMLAIYATAVRHITGLDWPRTLLAMIVPGAVVGVLSALGAIALVATLLRLMLS